MIKLLKRHWKVYREFFRAFIKTKLIYRTDFILGSINEILSFLTSLAFIGLLFTQVENINGWSFYELVFLYGFVRLVMSIHNFFLFAPYALGELYIINGRFDRFLVRPLNPLFQVYSSYIQMHAIPNFFAGVAILVYAAQNITIPLLTPVKVLYAIPAVISGVMVLAAIFLVFSTTGFWTGRTQSIFRFFWQFKDFGKYPFSIYPGALKTFLVTLMPIMFASFFPASFLLERAQYFELQILSLVAGPVFYLIAYRFWLLGVKNYSSTGS